MLEDAQQELEQPKASFIWMKNTQGQPSASLTFVTVAFAIVAISYIASIFTKVGPIEMRAFDGGACAAFLGPVLALYATRRYTDSKAPPAQ